MTCLSVQRSADVGAMVEHRHELERVLECGGQGTRQIHTKTMGALLSTNPENGQVLVFFDKDE